MYPDKRCFTYANSFQSFQGTLQSPCSRGSEEILHSHVFLLAFCWSWTVLHPPSYSCPRSVSLPWQSLSSHCPPPWCEYYGRTDHPAVLILLPEVFRSLHSPLTVHTILYCTLTHKLGDLTDCILYISWPDPHTEENLINQNVYIVMIVEHSGTKYAEHSFHQEMIALPRAVTVSPNALLIVDSVVVVSHWAF